MGLTKATITNLDTHEVVTCLFNPSEFTVNKANSWQPKPVVGKNVPRLDFTGGGSRILTMELFFDVYERPGGDVRTYIDRLWKLTLIDEKTRNKATRRARPPLCIFQWGGHWSFKAAVTNLSVRYTHFRQDGTPVRATANITLQEAEDEKDQPGTNPTSYSEPGYKSRKVEPQDTLDRIAFEEYGDASQWRRIAVANHLDDVLDLVPGQVLAIPPVD